jgi:hypothetical protein
MREANFFAVFVGIESPDTETLIAAQKKQNTRRNIADSVHKIYDAGMLVLAGFIVGFDTEGAGVAGAMVECIEATSIPVCMVGLLTALPNTQLTRRLEREGRLLPVDTKKGDQCTGGLNFITLRPRRSVLADFKSILEVIYQPAAYFGRVRVVGRALNRPNHSTKPSLMAMLRDTRLVVRLMWCMTFQRRDLRRHFWGTFIDCARNNPGGLKYVGMLLIFYLHLGSFASFLIEQLDQEIEMMDSPRRAAGLR